MKNLLLALLVLACGVRVEAGDRKPPTRQKPRAIHGISYRVNPPAALLSHVARITLECSQNPDMSNSTSNDDGNVVCQPGFGDGCLTGTLLSSGVNYCRHIYQTLADGEVSRGVPILIVVD